MLATIRDDTLNVPNMPQILKDGIIQTPPVVVMKTCPKF